MTRQQVRLIDQLAAEEFGLPTIAMMENAGRQVADLVLEILEDEMHLIARDAKVVIFCGGGNNGGDGYVIARHLANQDVQVIALAVSDPQKLTGDAAINCTIAQRMELITPATNDDALAAISQRGIDAHVVVDALLGTGFQGELKDHYAHAIDIINDAKNRGAVIISVDVPSGLDCETGHSAHTAVRADTTVTFVSPKTGMVDDPAAEYVGMLVVADIGAPAQLIERVSRSASL